MSIPGCLWPQPCPPGRPHTALLNLPLLHPTFQLPRSFQSWSLSKVWSPTTSLLSVPRGMSISSNPPHRDPSKSSSAVGFPSSRVVPSLWSWGIPRIHSSAQLSSAAEAEKAARGSSPVLAPSSPAPGAQRAPRSAGESSQGRIHSKTLAADRPAPFLPEGLILQDARCPSTHAECRVVQGVGKGK